MKRALCTLAIGVALLAAPFFAFASGIWSELSADVLIIGEFHDNPVHHQHQKTAVEELQPKAVIFEMLTPVEAAGLAKVARDEDTMRNAVSGFHWNNIADYAGVLAASPVIVGAALSREDMRAAFSEGAPAVFGEDAETYGLALPLAATELETRKQLQFEAHCEAMPIEMMGGMVEAQRLRDASFARTVLEALDTYGAPVILITGNGHARTDWGVPVYLAKARPSLTVESIGQGENGQFPPGTFDHLLLDAASPDRGDPCAAFR